MTIFYPAELLQNLEAGLTVTPRGGPTMLKPQRGRTFVRGGADSDPMMVDAAQTLAEAWQVALFNRFWEGNLKRGALPFWMPNQQFDNLPLMMPDLDLITMPDEEVIKHTAWWFCQFIGRPSQPSVQESTWRITFPLEVI